MRNAHLILTMIAGSSLAAADPTLHLTFDSIPDGLTGAALVDGKRGKAVHFSGSGCTVKQSPRLGGPFTVATWCRFSEFPKDYATILWLNQHINLRVGAGGVVTLSVGGWHTLMAKRAVPRDRWTHVAVTCNGSKPELFIDGKPWPDAETRPVNVQGRSFNVESVDIGMGNKQNLTGDLDDLRIYNRVLDATEIATLAAP